MADLKNTLFTYFAHRHIDLMPTDVRDRFEDYKKNGSFIGHMKKWDELYYGKPIQLLDTTITDPADWEKFYDAAQDTFQKMYENKDHPVGIGSDYNPATRAFIDRWFSTNPNSTFTTSKATHTAELVFDNLATWLQANKAKLFIPFKQHMSDVFPDNRSFDKFVKDLRDKEFNTNDEFRSKLQSVIQYIDYYQNNRDKTYLPDIKPKFDFRPIDPNDPTTWYHIPDKGTHIKWFQTDYVKIFDEILTNSVIRTKFLEMAKSPIKEALETAIADTDYENTEVDDYVAPKLTDSKNWIQKFKKWKNDTYENHFRRFTEVSRGTRLFFSPHSQNIIKGFDKAGIKPTDGLDGILSKKDDPKLQNAISVDPNTRKHFDWTMKTLETLKKETLDDFEGALRDGRHLQKLVINIIIKASRDKKRDEAMTALEVLSVAKYGLMSSRTFDKLSEATKDLTLFSSKDQSWNKNEAVQMFTNAIDKTARLAVRGVALIGTGVRNFVSHRRTKIGRFIGKYDNLNDEYKNWTAEDTKRHNDLRNSNVAHDVAGTLANLDNPGRTDAKYQTHVRINAGNIDQIKAELKVATDNGDPTVTLSAALGGTIENVTALQNDIDLYDDAASRQKQDNEWRDNNPDIIHDLVAYWDMLETFGKTHTFRLGSMKVKRDAMLKNFDLKKKQSEAQQQAWNFINNSYGALRAA
ncbi:MAG: hypothetical protein J5679_02990 [Alphaproteobacteria bacterium]|nr:hypothetical protein [Alphaproteobacteria bacterium]